MDDEHLIECVRQYEVLYDLSNPKYMDTSYKNEIWSKIAELLKSDGKLYLKIYLYYNKNHIHFKILIFLYILYYLLPLVVLVYELCTYVNYIIL